MKLLSYALLFAFAVQTAIAGLVVLAAFRDLSEPAVKRVAAALVVLILVQGFTVGAAALRALTLTRW